MSTSATFLSPTWYGDSFGHSSAAHARWRTVAGWPRFRKRLVTFVRGFFSGKPPTYVGHNPVARIYLSVLLLLLIVQGTTGLVIAGTDVYMPPFGSTMKEWVAADTHDPALVKPYAPDSVNAEAYAAMREFRSPFVEVHEYNFFILLTLIAFHIFVAVYAELREGGAIISAMFTGERS
jgi:cytochrome b